MHERLPGRGLGAGGREESGLAAAATRLGRPTASERAARGPRGWQRVNKSSSG
jgi:hypothetical protein